jgi:uncharacterized membrane-anchored protein
MTLKLGYAVSSLIFLGFFCITLGTALGDFVATTAGIGFERGALMFAALIALVAAAHFFTKIPGSVLFWAA